ncbi:hypothetical protein [Bacillus halotolerans]|nr:hypothetical protein [Bacillus halotolerans]
MKKKMIALSMTTLMGMTVLGLSFNSDTFGQAKSENVISIASDRLGS